MSTTTGRASPNPSPPIPERPLGSRLAWPLLACLLVYAGVLLQNAWMSDDSYITLRTIDNLVHGFGLRWNVAERVQTFTHPLWMMVLAVFYFFTREAYFTCLLVSVSLSVATVALALRRLCGSTSELFFATSVFVMSRAFIDYSTSGLENPLTHLLLVLTAISLRGETGDFQRRWVVICTLASLAALNRMDSLLLYMPLCVYLLWTYGGSRARAVWQAAAAFAPFVLWECFALVYYGFPFPNSAYAKLNTHLARADLLEQGVYYLLNSIRTDPVTPAAILLGLGAALWRCDGRRKAFAAGALSYLLYVLWIGGDFMAGRFLSAALVIAVAVLLASGLVARHGPGLGAALAVVAVGFLAPYPTVLTTPAYRRGEGLGVSDARGVRDEKGYYYEHTGLMRVLQEGRWRERGRTFPHRRWAADALYDRALKRRVVLQSVIGIYGYFAGPEIHIVDSWALGDPLLARLPFTTRGRWQVGHLERRIPAGYLETLDHGRLLIRDPRLARYHEKLRIVTAGEIWSMARWREIVRMNLGAYRDLIDIEDYL